MLTMTFGPRIQFDYNLPSKACLSADRHSSGASEEQVYERCREIIDQVGMLADNVARDGGPHDLDNPQPRRAPDVMTEAGNHTQREWLMDGKNGEKSKVVKAEYRCNENSKHHMVYVGGPDHANAFMSSHTEHIPSSVKPGIDCAGLGIHEIRKYSIRQGEVDATEEMVTVYLQDQQPYALRYERTVDRPQVNLNGLVAGAKSAYPQMQWTTAALPASAELLN